MSLTRGNSTKPMVNVDLVNTPRSTVYYNDDKIDNNVTNINSRKEKNVNCYIEPKGEVIVLNNNSNNNKNSNNNSKTSTLLNLHSRKQKISRPVEYVIYNSKIPSIYGVNYQMAQRAKETKAREAAAERAFAERQAAEEQCKAQEAKLAKQRERAALLEQLYKYNVEQAARRHDEQRRAKEERVKYEKALLASYDVQKREEESAERQTRLAHQREMQKAYEENMRNKSVDMIHQNADYYRSNDKNKFGEREKERCYQEQEDNYLFGDALKRDAERSAQVALHAKEVYKQNLALAENKRNTEKTHKSEEQYYARLRDEQANKELNEMKIKEQQRKQNAANALSKEWKTVMSAQARRKNLTDATFGSTNNDNNNNNNNNKRKLSLERVLEQSNGAYLGTQRQYQEDDERKQVERQRCKEFTQFNKHFAEEKRNALRKEREANMEAVRITAQDAACEADELRRQTLQRKHEQQLAMRAASEKAIQMKQTKRNIDKQSTMNEYNKNNDTVNNFYNGFSDAEKSRCDKSCNTSSQGHGVKGYKKLTQKEYFEELHREAERRHEAKKREEAKAMAWEKQLLAQEQKEYNEEKERERLKRTCAAEELKRSLEAQIKSKRQLTCNNNNSSYSSSNQLHVRSVNKSGNSSSPYGVNDVSTALTNTQSVLEPERKILYRCPVTHRLLPANAFDFGMRHRYANNESTDSALIYELSEE